MNEKITLKIIEKEIFKNFTQMPDDLKELKTQEIKNKIVDLLINIHNDLIDSQEEIISKPIRFNGVNVKRVEQIFSSYGINIEKHF